MDGTEYELDSGISDAELFADAPEGGVTQDPGNNAAPENPTPATDPQLIQQPAAAEPAPGQQDQGHRIPLAEHLAERERRQQFERDLAEERRQRADLQRQLEAFRNPQQPADLLTNPQGFQESIDQRFERMQRQFEQQRTVDRINTSFSFAERQHGEEFKKAFDAFSAVAGVAGQNDEMLRNRVVHSPDPGEAVMRWFRSQQILQESGGDLGAFKDRLLKDEQERLLKDPQFLARAVQAARGIGSSNPTIRPGNPTGLPSLTRTTSAAPNQGDDDGPLSDAELFRMSSGGRR